MMWLHHFDTQFSTDCGCVFVELFNLYNFSTKWIRTLDGSLGTLPLVSDDVTELHLDTTSELGELATMVHFVNQLGGESVGDGLVGGRVGHPARGAGRHLK